MKTIIIFCLIVATVAGIASDQVQADSPADTVKASLENYFNAWSQPNAEKRTALLKTAWADDGIYTDPTAHVEGRAALIKHIGEVLSSPQFQGASIVQASGIDIHHQVFRFEWDMQDADGKSITKGMDYGEFNDQGVIIKIIGFFGPFPAMN